MNKTGHSTLIALFGRPSTRHRPKPGIPRRHWSLPNAAHRVCRRG